MTYENNEKYVGEVWLENQKEDEFKKSFLQSLIKEIQKHGNGFDADMVDGKHYWEIIKEFKDEMKDSLIPFKIGNTAFNTDSIQSAGESMFIGFEGVQYNPADFLDEELSWEDHSSVKNLLEVFQDLYDYVDGRFSSIDEATSVLELLQDNNYFQVTKDEDTGEVESTFLVADSINGLRFYVEKQTDYDNLPAEVKNDIHNVFIIVDNNAVIPEDIINRKPGTQPLSQYYQFRIQSDVDYTDPETGEVKQVKMLQYKHQSQENWHDIAPTYDFIDYKIIQSFFSDLLSDENAEYTINQNTFNQAFAEVDPNLELMQDSPLIQYIKDNGIAGAKYTDLNNQVQELPNTGEETPYYINLDGFTSFIDSKINNAIASFIDLIYPIGSIYMSYGEDNNGTVQAVNPNTKFPGTTWVKIENAFLYGSGQKSLRSTGGYMDAVLASHYHTVNSHNHTPTGLGDFLVTIKPKTNVAVNAAQKRSLPPENKNGHHILYVPNGELPKESGIVENRGTSDASPGTNRKGEDPTEKNMPPYVTVDIWRRTG